MDDKNRSVSVQLTELPPSRESQRDLVTSPHNLVVPARAWPQEPQPLIQPREVSIPLLLYDAGLALLSIGLVAKVGLVIVAWNKDKDKTDDRIDTVSDLTTVLLEFNGQMVTAFTIIFVTIVSTLVKRYALWKAQKGAYISELEQLQGSVSMPSTFKLIWSLRAYSATSVGLVAIWCFYYLGSQASQREYKFATSAGFKKLPMGVPGPKMPSIFSSNLREVPTISTGDVNVAYIIADKKYSDAKVGKLPGTDSDGNALLPRLKQIISPPPDYHFNTASFALDDEGWYDVSTASEVRDVTAYSAKAGAKPIVWDEVSAGFNYTGWGQLLGDFTFNTSYLDIDCSAAAIYAYEDFPKGTLPTQAVSLNMSRPRDPPVLDAAGHPLREFELWNRWLANTNNETDAYGDLLGVSFNGSSLVRCNVTTVDVEAQINCKEQGCTTQKVRYPGGKSLLESSSHSTPFDDDEFAAKFFNSTILISGPQTSLGALTDVGWVLYTSLEQTYDGTPDSIEYRFQSMVNWWNIELGLLFNTYYILSQAEGVTGYAGVPKMDVIKATGSDAGFVRSTLDGAVYSPHYAIYWPWIVVDFVSCSILLIAALASAWLRYQTLAPDIFGYVSSLTRDNPNVDLPNTGTTLGGIERALMLKKIKVKIGDVSAPNEPGRVGLARVDSEIGSSQRHVDDLRRTVDYRYV